MFTVQNISGKSKKLDFALKISCLLLVVVNLLCNPSLFPTSETLLFQVSSHHQIPFLFHEKRQLFTLSCICRSIRQKIKKDFSLFSFRYVVFLKLIALYSQQLRAAKEQKEVRIRVSIIVE